MFLLKIILGHNVDKGLADKRAITHITKRQENIYNSKYFLVNALRKGNRKALGLFPLERTKLYFKFVLVIIYIQSPEQKVLDKVEHKCRNQGGKRRICLGSKGGRSWTKCVNHPCTKAHCRVWNKQHYRMEKVTNSRK